MENKETEQKQKLESVNQENSNKLSNNNSSIKKKYLNRYERKVALIHQLYYFMNSS